MAAFPTRAHSGMPRPAAWLPSSSTPTSAADSPALPRGERRPEPADFALVDLPPSFPSVYDARRRIDEKDTCHISSTDGVCQSGIRSSQAPPPRPSPSSSPWLMQAGVLQATLFLEDAIAFFPNVTLTQGCPLRRMASSSVPPSIYGGAATTRPQG